MKLAERNTKGSGPIRAEELGYLRVPKDVLIEIEAIKNYTPGEIVPRQSQTAGPADLPLRLPQRQWALHRLAA